jgi:mannose-6-phosphate isomerase-like protein (cupin superfamily)
MSIKNLKKKKVIFPKIKNMGKREWGSEKLVALIPRKISLKVLCIKKGKKGGLQFHRRKNECGYLVSGKLLVRFDNGKGKLKSKIIKSGQSFHFPPFSIHQEKALTDCLIVEASTPHFNDRVRVEKFYGIKNYSGLPTTKLKNIVLK